MSRTIAVTAVTLALACALAADAPSASAARLGAIASQPPPGPMMLAQSSGRLGELQLDGMVGSRGLNDGLSDEGTSVLNRRFGTFTGNRLGQMNGAAFGTITGNGLGSMTGSGLGAMTGSGLGTPTGRGLGGLSTPPSLRNPVQPRGAVQP